MVALVTGGTRGIGAAISIGLKEAGFTVAANFSSDTETAEKFKEETGIPVYQWWIESPEQCLSGVNKIEKDLGPVSVLINNAGVTRDSMFHKMAECDWHVVIDINVNGLFNMTKPVWELMRKRNYGRVVNISSINGQKGQMGQVNYSTAKAATIGFTKALAQEGAKKGITVNTVCPGYTATDMVKAMPEEALNKTVSQIPIGRLGEPEEIARCVTFLASYDSGFITGSTITANGGQFIF